MLSKEITFFFSFSFLSGFHLPDLKDIQMINMEKDRTTLDPILHIIPTQIHHIIEAMAIIVTMMATIEEGDQTVIGNIQIEEVVTRIRDQDYLRQVPLVVLVVACTTQIITPLKTMEAIILRLAALDTALIWILAMDGIILPL
jgi:hypothetical protein